MLQIEAFNGPKRHKVYQQAAYQHYAYQTVNHVTIFRPIGFVQINNCIHGIQTIG